MAFFMGVDIGTSSVKVAIFDENGAAHALCAEEYDLICEKSGWAEQHPETWWAAFARACQKAVLQFGRSSKEICAVGVSNQMHSLVVLDAEMRCVRPSILHNDSRTGKQAEFLRAKLGENAEEITKNPIYTGMTLCALLWIRDNEPQNYARIRHAMLAGDYIRYMLTGEISTDHANASATLAYDFARKDWSDTILNAAGVSKSMFPPCHDSFEIAGAVTRQAAEKTALFPGTTVVFGGGDQVMQSIGSFSINPGQATVNIGSGAQICVQTSAFFANPAAGVNAFTSYRRDKWYLMGANSNGGSAYKWFCANILKTGDYKELDLEVSRVRPGSDGLIFLPYLSGERCPHRNFNLSGAFWGLTYLTDRKRMARAAMEGITFSLYDCLKACQSSGASPTALTALGGGARSPVWRQMLADVFDLPIHTTTACEQAVLGAAISASVGCGCFENCADACKSMVRIADFPLLPRARVHETYMDYYGVYFDLYRLARPALERVTKLGRTPAEFAEDARA